MKYLVRIVAVALGVAALATVLSVTMAQDDAVDALPEVIITNSADGLDVPETLPNGLVVVHFDNQSEAPMLPVPVRLNEGVTQDAFMETVISSGEMAALSLVSLQGGTLVVPGVAVDITYDLAAGRYALIDFAAQESSMKWFGVADGGEDEVIDLSSDIHVSLYDFAFAMPLDFETGPKM